MTGLTTEQLDRYNSKGYISPINALSSLEAKEVRDEIEKIEKDWPGALEGINRNYIHLISPIFNKVCLNKNILDAVESIIGKNILICGTTLFIKNPNEKGFVSFHQDAKYIGLEPHNWVTAWVAITDANEKNGCMRMLPGSHKENLKPHEQKFDENNLLTRGQTVKNVSLESAENALIAMKNWVGIDHLKNIKNKTLIVWGDKDTSYNLEQVETLNKNIKDSKLEIFKNCGHNVHLEQPSEFNFLIKEFINQ